MNKVKKKKYEPRVLAAVFLFLCMGVAFFLTSRRITDLAMESSFHMLRQSTQQLCRELYYNAGNHQKLLESIADQIVNFPEVDSEGTRRLLAEFKESGPLTRLEILFPNNRLLQANGAFIDASGMLSFVETVPKGSHISTRGVELDGSGKMVLRAFEPIVKDGETKAILCGVVDLEKMREFYPVDTFLPNSALVVIEGKSGDFLVDTIHTSLGNVRSVRNRKLKPGYDAEQVLSDMKEMRAGRTAFASETFGEYLYCGYAPVGINDWMVLFSLPESVALADANKIRSLLCLLAALEAVLLVLFFAWLLSRRKKESDEKEIQLNRIQAMLDIEETLFDAARKPRLIVEALHKVAKMLTAEGSFFLTRMNPQENQVYTWRKQSGKAETQELEPALVQRCLSLGSQLTKTEGIVCYDSAKLVALYEIPEQAGIKSLMLVPVMDSDQVVLGVLGAVNMTHYWKTAELLESVKLSFSMAINNIETFHRVREMGMIDHLTGLLNRNSFQKAMEGYEKSQDYSLACAYIDVDGLHELNNQCGHISGDRMLQAVADALKAEFGEENSYRIGGDEFVSFCLGFSPEQVCEKVRNLEQSLAAQGYHISIGIEWRHEVPLMHELVKQAEAKMYEAKRSYYESQDSAEQAREMNRQLEELLMEKRDLDVFRSVLSSKYRGVYIVNLSLDSMRFIYIPRYFEKAMQLAGGKFSEAIRIYVQESVRPEYQEAFFKLLDYEQVERRLNRGEEPSLCYQKTDGVFVLLKIYRSPEYSQRTRECIWSFENRSQEGA